MYIGICVCVCVCVCLVLKCDVTSAGKIYPNRGGPFCIDIQVLAVKNCKLQP